MKASGCNVLSEEYSNPSFITLVSIMFPISSELRETNRFSPFAEVTFDKEGSFLYSDPPDKSFILFAGPDADREVVVYSNLSHSVDEYDNFSGFCCNETWNVVVPTPEIG